MTLKCFIFYNPWNCRSTTLTNCRLSIPRSLSSSVNAGSIRTWETYYCNKKIYPTHITDHISESRLTPAQGLIHILAKCFTVAILRPPAQPFPPMLRQWEQKFVSGVRVLRLLGFRTKLFPTLLWEMGTIMTSVNRAHLQLYITLRVGVCAWGMCLNLHHHLVNGITPREPALSRHWRWTFHLHSADTIPHLYPCDGKSPQVGPGVYYHNLC